MINKKSYQLKCLLYRTDVPYEEKQRVISSFFNETKIVDLLLTYYKTATIFTKQMTTAGQKKIVFRDIAILRLHETSVAMNPIHITRSKIIYYFKKRIAMGARRQGERKDVRSNRNGSSASPTVRHGPQKLYNFC